MWFGPCAKPTYGTNVKPTINENEEKSNIPSSTSLNSNQSIHSTKIWIQTVDIVELHGWIVQTYYKVNFKLKVIFHFNKNNVPWWLSYWYPIDMIFYRDALLCKRRASYTFVNMKGIGSIYTNSQSTCGCNKMNVRRWIDGPRPQATWSIGKVCLIHRRLVCLNFIGWGGS